MLKIRDLTIGYRSRNRTTKRVAHNLNLALDAGEFVCLLGPNGAGKSTLMRTIAGMQPALTGEVWLDGVALRTLTPNQRATKLSVVLTDRTTAGLSTGYAMISLGRFPHTGWFGRLTPEDHGAIRKAIRLAGAESFSHRFVSELSDGERQRVMMARALAQEPRLMILDEITAFLDLPRRIEVMNLLRDLARGPERGILISTHDLELALRTADRLWLMRADGVISVGAPEDLALDGSLAAAFADEGIAFDPMRGAFRPSQEVAGGTVRVVGGDDMRRSWTVRAVERAGHRVAEEGRASSENAVVEILSGGGWRRSDSVDSTLCATLYELVAHLRRRSETGGAAPG